MNDNLIIGIFKELAVLDGARTVSGKWINTDEVAFRRLLQRAIRIAKVDYDIALKGIEGGK